MRLFMLLILFFNMLFSASLLFKSSFEEGVYLDSPDKKGSQIWWQEIRGSDNEDFSWPITINQKEAQFQMITNKSPFYGYIENEIETIINDNGDENRVLHQVIKEKDHPWTQDPYVLYTNGDEQKKLYIRYSLKFPKNLSEILGPDGWLTFSEYKTYGDYRQALYVYSDKNKHLYWYVHGDNVVKNDIPYQEYWKRENRNVSVLEGEWMDIEIFWNRSQEDDGRFWLAVDGEIIFNYFGSTKKAEAIHQIMLFTNYANVPIEQWIDNVEIWDNFPCGIGKSCYRKNE